MNGLLCDDGDPCTVGDFCAGDQCRPGVDLCECRGDGDCASREDGDLCNGTLYCDLKAAPFRCRMNPSSPITCGAKGDTSCASTVCEPSTGQCISTAVNNGLACDDLDKCTASSYCLAGQCKAEPGGLNYCPCLVDVACELEYGDGDACTGVYYCDNSTLPYACRINAASVITCGTASNSTCMSNTCQPKTGDCALKALVDGKACEGDGLGCTADACEAGACVVGSCDCESHADCAAAGDGNVCNGIEYCDMASKKCVVNPVTILVCPSGDDTTCALNACVPATGACLKTPVQLVKEFCDAGKGGCRYEVASPGEVSQTAAVACDDGKTCTLGDHCEQGECATSVVDCICKDDAWCKDKEDGNLCNGTLFCNKATQACELVPNTVEVCKSVNDTDCLKNACLPANGACSAHPVEFSKQVCDVPGTGGSKLCRWEVAPPGSATVVVDCDDGDECTAAGNCAAGVCKAGTFICACSQDSECAKFEDGDLCNGTNYCDKLSTPATCKVNPASVVSCTSVDDSECVKNGCVQKTGECLLQPLTDGALCDDGSVCTKNDTCQSGQCQPGTKTCCETNDDCLVEDDGDLCNGVPYCNKAAIDAKTGKATHACEPNPAAAVFCSAKEDTDCLKSACDPKTGACKGQPVKDGAPCQDGSQCTTGDGCNAGKCAANPVSCNDSDACTSDSCDPLTGCVHGASNCDDGNQCTVDLCDPKSGKCAFGKPLADGSSCNGDNSGCTVNDVCEAGVCKTGAAIICQLSLGPCHQALCVGTGPTTSKCEKIKRPDGDSCDDGAICTLGATCAAGECIEGQTGKLFVLSVAAQLADEATPSGWFNAAVAMADGGWAMAGGFAPSGQNKVVQAGWWLVRGDDAMAKTSQYLAPVQGAGAVATAQAGVAVGKQAVFAGAVAGPGGDLDVQLVWLAKEATPILAKTFGDKGFDAKALALAAHLDSSLAVVGDRSKAGIADGLALHVDKQGLMLWQSVVDGGSASESFAAVAPLADGSVLLAGATFDGVLGGDRGWLVSLDAAGKTSWQRKVGGSPSQGLTAIAVRTSGDFVAGGWRHSAPGKRHYWLVGLNIMGELSWERTSSSYFEVNALALQPGGRPVVVGRSATAGAASSGWLMGADVLGNTHWTRALAGSGESTLTALVASGGAGLLAVGTITEGALGHGLIVRADAWGHASCEEAGPCAGKKLADCVDDDACTLDLCTKSEGCAAAATAGLACEYPGGCVDEGICAKGVCTEGSKTRIYTRAFEPADVTDMAPPAPTSDGGFVLAGSHATGGLRLWRLDKFGQPTQVGLAKPSKPVARVMAAVAQQNGSVGVYVFRAGGINAAGKPFFDSASLVYVNPAFEVTGEAAFCTYYGCAFHDLDAVDANHIVAVIPGSNSFGQYLLVRKYPIASSNYTWASKLGPAGAFQVYSEGRVRALPSGGAIAMARRRSLIIKGNDDGTAIGQFESGGASVWQRLLEPSARCALIDAVPAQGGGFVALGWQEVGGGKLSRWLTKLSSQGDTLWSRVSKDTTSYQPAGLVAQDDGSFMVGGIATLTKPRPWLGAFDSLGSPLWENVQPAPGGGLELGSGRPFVALADGGYAVLAAQVIGGSRRPYLLRSNPWGAGSCKAAGDCPVAAAPECDDGKTCTTDLCLSDGLGAHSCKHVAWACEDDKLCTAHACEDKGGCKLLAQGAACDDGDACTGDFCSDWTGCAHAAETCNDGDPCTLDACIKLKGCSFQPTAEAKPCAAAGCGAEKAVCKAGKCTVQPGAPQSGCSAATAATSCQVISGLFGKGHSGVYVLHPEGPGGSGKPFEAVCETDLDGGGWTLALTSSDDGQANWTWEDRGKWSHGLEVVGSVNKPHLDFSSPALHRLPFKDLLFVHQPSGIWAAYHNIGQGGGTVAQFLDSPALWCFPANGAGFPMSAGTLKKAGQLCNTNLYVHGQDVWQPKGYISCASQTDQGSMDHAWGPTWLTWAPQSGPYHRCKLGFENPGFEGAMGPVSSSPKIEGGALGFGLALGLNSGTKAVGANYLQIYVR